jgi:hypothetical protein
MTEKDFSTKAYMRFPEGELLPVIPFAIVSNIMVEVISMKTVYGYKQGEHLVSLYANIVHITRTDSDGKYWTKTLDREEFPHKPTTIIYH